MIKIIVATPKGELINKEVDSIVASGDTGQVGILTNRLPLLMKITRGFVKVNDNEVQYVGIVNGVIDFKDNILYKGYTLSDYNKHKQRTAVRGLRTYLKELEENSNFETELLEVGDGLTISKKIG